MRINRFILIAAIASGSMIVANVRADDGSQTNGSTMQNTENKTANAADNAGTSIRTEADKMTAGSTTQPGEAADAKDIRKTLRNVTETAATKGDFKKLIGNFVDSDSKRLDQDSFVSQDHTTLDGRIAQLQKDWKAKYNQDLKFKDLAMVYDPQFVTIVQSRNGENAQMASEQQSAINPSSVDKSQTPASEDKSLQTGRSVATVTLSAEPGLSALAIPLVHEFPDSWRIDVPDNYTAQQLHDNLLTQLTTFDQNMNQWPNDVNQAERQLTHRVLIAVMNANNGTNVPDSMHENNSDMNTH